MKRYVSVAVLFWAGCISQPEEREMRGDAALQLEWDGLDGGSDGSSPGGADLAGLDARAALDGAPMQPSPSSADLGPSGPDLAQVDLGDPCAGVTCDTPPAATCLTATSVRAFFTNGICAAGACSYTSFDSSCGGGCSGGVCNQCAGGFPPAVAGNPSFCPGCEPHYDGACDEPDQWCNYLDTSYRNNGYGCICSGNLWLCEAN